MGGNQSKRNIGDGFQVRSNNTTLDDNEAERNTAEGIEIVAVASGTTLSDNRAEDNRNDFCDEGTGTIDGGGNDFETVGTPCLDE